VVELDFQDNQMPFEQQICVDAAKQFTNGIVNSPLFSLITELLEDAYIRILYADGLNNQPLLEACPEGYFARHIYYSGSNPRNLEKLIADLNGDQILSFQFVEELMLKLGRHSTLAYNSELGIYKELCYMIGEQL
jgi:hypothetical protein